MYRFSFTESVAGRATEVTREMFHEIIRREKLKTVCADIAQTTDTDLIGKLKRKLPAFCWHAWFDEGKRKNYAAHASGLIMIDVDHIDNPRDVYNEVAEAALAMGLLAAHVTPSTHGLRLVFPVPEGMDIVKAQSYYAHALGLQVDACTKDLARLSFAVPEEYWLYVDEEGLFEPTKPSEPSEPSPGPSRQGRGIVSSAVEKIEVSSAVEKPEEVIIPLPLREGPGEGSFPSSYDGLPYALLVESLQELLGGEPAHGSRNNFIFSMAAYLRYVCNDDAEWIAQVLPTYGEAADKWRRTIDSACQRSQYKQMPQIVRRAIELAKSKVECAKGSVDEEGNGLPPEMPKKLPKVIAHLVKNVPEVCRPAVANAVFPALGAHLKGVKFWLIDGTEKEATFMCVTMAKQSSGKSAVNKPIDYIIADIVERDEISRQREQDWKDAMAQKGANKEKPKRPDDLCVQVLVSDMTNAAFVQRMKDADGKYLYTNLEELDLLKQLQTNGTKDVGKIICLCFDNGKYGQERVGTQSVTARVDLRWNWNASSTIQKGIKFFQGRLVDGTLSRINVCTIVEDKSKPFVYGRYDEKYGEQLKPYITNLNLATGHVECKQALDLAQRMLDSCQEQAALTDDDVLQDLAYRAVTIAYLKAMVLYICNDMTWTKDIADFTQWSLDYDLWCKQHFFGDLLAEDKSHEEVRKTRGRQNLLDLLPDTFTLQQAQEMRRQQGMDDAALHMIRTWVYRGYVERDDISQLYTKTDSYLKRA